ncbi:NAD(P)-dependent oxidoreductase [Verrucomicrobia bacterium]|jgi:3-hydroxyisobutyrate dehydrogenase|nr:NAD(P)-dependent oxidoreductase [Verrucomicrobiota bacterium]NCG26757.1 NAD-binding protein [Verrucomicrobiales bacterium]RZO13767.1 MAG: NAD(P)-dependent oxidoreductase [Verrucomicrobiaceae bacterium]
MSQKIGFVGIGRMGANMARNLKDRGYTISSVNDINKEAAAELAAELGCSHAEKLADVTESSDIIFTVITNDDAMRSIYFSDDDNLLMSAEGKTFVNCATLSPGIQQEVAKAAENAGAGALEGCMASSIPQAREGKLYLMIGGQAELFEETKPVLEDMSINLKHIGEIGKAAQVKALVNMVMNINTAGLAEGLGLADSLGLDLEMICDVFSQTGANSRVLETDAEDMIARDHEAWFTAEHAAKDSGIAASIAKEVGINLPLNDATCAQFNKLVSDGKGDLDKSGVAELTFKGRHP